MSVIRIDYNLRPKLNRRSYRGLLDRSCAGAALVELALFLPILLTFGLALIDLTYSYRLSNLATVLSREVALSARQECAQLMGTDTACLDIASNTAEQDKIQKFADFITGTNNKGTVMLSVFALNRNNLTADDQSHNWVFQNPTSTTTPIKASGAPHTDPIRATKYSISTIAALDPAYTLICPDSTSVNRTFQMRSIIRVSGSPDDKLMCTLIFSRPSVIFIGETYMPRASLIGDLLFYRVNWGIAYDVFTG